MTNGAGRSAGRLLLLGRPDCHLCQDMEAALRDLQAEHGFHLDILDIDEHGSRFAAYSERIPVLFGDDAELCHYFLDPQAVRRYLGLS